LVRGGKSCEVAPLANVEGEVARRAEGHDEVDVRLGFLWVVRSVKVDYARDSSAHQAVLELDNVAVGDPLEDRDLRLEVLEQLGSKLAPDDRFDGHRCARVL